MFCDRGENYHFYEDGTNLSFYDKYGMRDQIHLSSEMLKYMDHRKPLEIDIDFRNMLSLVVAQTQGKYIYVLKNFYTLPPHSTFELVETFCDYFGYHKKRN